MSFRRLVGGAVSWHVMHLLCVQPVLPGVAPGHLEHGVCCEISKPCERVCARYSRRSEACFSSRKGFQGNCPNIETGRYTYFSVPIVRAVEAWCEDE